jgi:hypothetical protein
MHGGLAGQTHPGRDLGQRRGLAGLGDGRPDGSKDLYLSLGHVKN